MNWKGWAALSLVLGLPFFVVSWLTMAVRQRWLQRKHDERKWRHRREDEQE